MTNLDQHKTKFYGVFSNLHFLSYYFLIFQIIFFVCFFRTDLQAKTSAPFSITVQAIFVDGILWEGRQDSISLRSSETLTILFSSSSQDTFYYYLDEYDSAPKKAFYPIAIYNNLRKGVYHFHQSMTTNFDATKGIVITVENSFFEEWGFIPLLILYLTILFGGAGYIIFISNLRNQNKFSELRTNWTNKLHNDIGAELSSITMRLSTLKRKLETQPNLQKNVLKVNKTITKIQAQLRTAFNLIDEQKISIHTILSDIQNFAEENCELVTTQLKFHNELSPQERYKIDERRTNTLHSIMKESISNLTKHAKADLATISIIEEKDGIQIIIEDNGVGFDINKPSSRNGIENIYTYGQKGAMDINIKSVIDQGTSISIFAPYL